MMCSTSMCISAYFSAKKTAAMAAVIVQVSCQTILHALVVGNASVLSHHQQQQVEINTSMKKQLMLWHQREQGN